MTLEWKGVFPALTTNFTSDDELDLETFNKNIEFQLDAGVNGKVTLAMFEDMLDCENIQAVKESTRDVTNVTRMINAFGDRYKVLCGVDTIAMEEMLLGAQGWVAGLETGTIYQAGGNEGGVWFRACTGSPAETGRKRARRSVEDPRCRAFDAARSSRVS